MSAGQIDFCNYDPHTQLGPPAHETLYGHLALLLSSAHPDNIDNVINRSLAILGQVYDVDRVFVIKIDTGRNTMSNTHEWCREGISQEINLLQGMPFEQYSYTLSHFEQNKVLNVQRVEDLPEQAKPEREIFSQQSIKSCFMVPTRSSRGLEGCVGFDAVREYRQWTDVEVDA